MFEEDNDKEGISLESDCHTDRERSCSLQAISGSLFNAKMQLNLFQKRVLIGWRGQSHTEE